MFENKAGAYVEKDEAAPRERGSLDLILQPFPSPTLITAKAGYQVVPSLGFTHDGSDALNAKREFADKLYQIACDLDQEHSANPPTLPDLTDEHYEKSLEAAVTLSEDSSLLALDELRQYGSALRKKLDKDFVAALKLFGFPQADPAKEPALTFTNNKQPPILWDMMYEDVNADPMPQWENFWGFRVPITHWEAIPRNDMIRLKNGLFSAIDHTLKFANSEVALLARQLKSGLLHRTLSEELKERAKPKLCERLKLDSSQADAWVEAAPDCWLSKFLAESFAGENEQARAELERRLWKRETVTGIFNPQFAYELVHFACHCQPGKLSELATQLNINIAGENMALDVATMATGRTLTPETPGPLVFLNACGTGQQNQTNEPPGFPDVWIRQHGALAVVTTLCPVPDLFAHAFALKFYRFLFAAGDPGVSARPRYVGEVLLQTRRYFMEQCNNPLGLAYMLYGVRDVRVEAEC